MYREIMWNEESEDHIARHEVAPREVEEVVNSRPIYTVAGRDDTTLVYGSSAAGRRLLVVLSESSDGRWFVVTARNMTDAEARAHRRKGR